MRLTYTVVAPPAVRAPKVGLVLVPVAVIGTVSVISTITEKSKLAMRPYERWRRQQQEPQCRRTCACVIVES